MIETFRPGVVERLGLGYDDLAHDNPGLVYASVTAFGRTGPLADVKGYEGPRDGAPRRPHRDGRDRRAPGPAFCARAVHRVSGAQTALHGILAALFEREPAAVGQRVDTTLVQGFAAHDTWNVLIAHIARQYPEAFTQAALADDGRVVPNNPLFFRLLVALSADGRWLQFSQTTPRLFAAFMRVARARLDVRRSRSGRRVPDFDDIDQRAEYFELHARRGRARRPRPNGRRCSTTSPTCGPRSSATAASCSTIRRCMHDRSVVDRRRPRARRGRASRARWCSMHATPGRGRPLGADARRARRRRCVPATARVSRDRRVRTPPSTPTTRRRSPASPCVELGTYYAAPYGATLLTDLGARVIKIEQLDGDPIRHIIPFPEVGAVKVLQGKESVAVDIHTDDGREIVHELVRHADAVLSSFRAGVVERLGLDADDAARGEPRPRVPQRARATASTGRAATAPRSRRRSAPAPGWRGATSASRHPQGPDLDVEVVKPTALRIAQAAMGVGHADGFSALGVGDRAAARTPGTASAARRARRCRRRCCSPMAHVLVEDMVEYDGAPDAAHGRPGAPRPLGALPPLRDRRRLGVPRRARAASSGTTLATALAPYVDLAADPRFADEDATRRQRRRARRDPGRRCSASSRPASGRTSSRAVDVGCLAVRDGAPDRQLFADGGLGRPERLDHRRRAPGHRHAPAARCRWSSSRARRRSSSPSALCGAAHRRRARASSATTPSASPRCATPA